MLSILWILFLVSGIRALRLCRGEESVYLEEERKKKTGISSRRACMIFGWVQILIGSVMLVGPFL